MSTYVVMSEENQSQSSLLSLNFVIFILAILIVANTEKEEWFALDYQTYYYFIVFSLLASSTIIFTTCIACTGMLCVESACGKIFIAMATVLPFLVLVVFYVFICMIWHHDPNHTILFFKEFWTEASFIVVAKKSTYYYMGDVIIRIYSTFFLILSCILPCVLGAGCAALKKHEVQTTPSVL